MSPKVTQSEPETGSQGAAQLSKGIKTFINVVLDES